ncbi:MAG: hypothetical protein ACE5PV_16345 [Candidatus Poribacteria bacterium]
MSIPSKTNDTVIIPEAIKQFDEEWVAFEVYDRDERNRAYKGRLITHSPNRREVWLTVNKLKLQDCFVCFVGEAPPKGMEVVI